MRFTIRDLLWLTAVVALGLAWRVEHRRYVALEHNYEDLKSDVVWCPDDMKIVWDEKRGFSFEPRSTAPARHREP